MGYFEKIVSVVLKPYFNYHLISIIGEYYGGKCDYDVSKWYCVCGRKKSTSCFNRCDHCDHTICQIHDGITEYSCRHSVYYWQRSTHSICIDCLIYCHGCDTLSCPLCTKPKYKKYICYDNNMSTKCNNCRPEVIIIKSNHDDS